MRRLIPLIGVLVALILPTMAPGMEAQTNVPITDTVLAFPTAELELPLTPQAVVSTVQQFRDARRGDAFVLVEPGPQPLKCVGLTGDAKYVCQLETALYVGAQLKGGLVGMGIPAHYIFVKPTVVEGWEGKVNIFLMDRDMLIDMGVPLPSEEADADGDGTPDWIDDCPLESGSAFKQGCPAPESVITVRRDGKSTHIPSLIQNMQPETGANKPLLPGLPALENPSGNPVADIQAMVKEAVMQSNDGVWFDIGWNVGNAEATGYYEHCRKPKKNGRLVEICWRVDAGVRDDNPMAGGQLILQWEW